MQRNVLNSTAAFAVILVSGAAGYWITDSPLNLPSLPIWQEAHAADSDEEASPVKGDACCSTSEGTDARSACCSASEDSSEEAPCCSTAESSDCAKSCCSSDSAQADKPACCSGKASSCCETSSVESSAEVEGGVAETSVPASAAACCEADASNTAAPCCEADAMKSDAAADGCCPPTEGEAWTMEKVAEFRAKGDWCSSHGVPESMCVKCNADLVAGFIARGDWCAGHRLPSSLCSICQPRLSSVGIGRDWCAAHGVPESQCVHCRPELGVIDAVEGGSFQARMVEAVRGVAQAELTFAAPEGNSDPVHRTGLNPNCPLHGITIDLNSKETSSLSGLVIENAREESVHAGIDCFAEVEFDQTRFAHVSPRSSGTIHAVHVDFGQTVSAGEELALVDSAEFGQAKAALLRADAAMEKWKAISGAFEEGAASGAVPKKDLIEARAELRSAEIERKISMEGLRNYGLSDAEIAQVLESNDASTLLPVRAPFNGVVLDRKGVLGDRVEPGTEICAVADLSSVWLCLDLPADEVFRVKQGASVEFRVDSIPDRVFQGKVSWISAEIDPKTRLGKARAVIPNPDGILKAGLFGRGSISGQTTQRVTLAPRDAVQWDGCCNVVFVQKGDSSFEPRKVQVGESKGDYVAVLAGLLPGEPIVTQGSFLLKTEILKGNIGAGCCADHGSGSTTSHVEAESPGRDQQVEQLAAH